MLLFFHLIKNWNKWNNFHYKWKILDGDPTIKFPMDPIFSSILVQKWLSTTCKIHRSLRIEFAISRVQTTIRYLFTRNDQQRQRISNDIPFHNAWQLRTNIIEGKEEKFYPPQTSLKYLDLTRIKQISSISSVKWNSAQAELVSPPRRDASFLLLTFHLVISYFLGHGIFGLDLSGPTVFPSSSKEGIQSCDSVSTSIEMIDHGLVT